MKNEGFVSISLCSIILFATQQVFTLDAYQGEGIRPWTSSTRPRRPLVWPSAPGW